MFERSNYVSGCGHARDSSFSRRLCSSRHCSSRFGSGSSSPLCEIYDIAHKVISQLLERLGCLEMMISTPAPSRRWFSGRHDIRRKRSSCRRIPATNAGLSSASACLCYTHILVVAEGDVFSSRQYSSPADHQTQRATKTIIDVTFSPRATYSLIVAS